MKNKRHVLILATIGVLLLIPLIAMQFSNEVNWTGVDFAVAAGILLFFGLGIEFLIRKLKDRRYRFFAIAGALVVLLLLWIELAVGIFGSPIAGS